MKFKVPGFTINSTLMFCAMMLLTTIIVSSITPSHAQIAVVNPLSLEVFPDEPIEITFIDNIDTAGFTISTISFRFEQGSENLRVTSGATADQFNNYSVTSEPVMFELIDSNFIGDIVLLYSATIIVNNIAFITIAERITITVLDPEINLTGFERSLSVDESVSIHYTDLINSNLRFEQLTITFDYRDSSHRNILDVTDGATISSLHDNDFLMNKETVEFELLDPNFRGSIIIDFIIEYNGIESQLASTIRVIDTIPDKLMVEGITRLADDCLTESQNTITRNRIVGHFGAVNSEKMCFENNTFVHTQFLIDTNNNILKSQAEKSNTGFTDNIGYDWDGLNPGILYGSVLVMTGNYNAQGQGEYTESTVFYIINERTIGDPQRTCSINNINNINFGLFYDGQTSSEEMMTIINNGTEIAAVNLSADDWVDGNNNIAMNAQQTVVANTPNVGFDEKTPLLSDIRIATIQPFDQSQVYIQTKVNLLDDDFRGQIMQDMTMTLIC